MALLPQKATEPFRIKSTHLCPLHLLLINLSLASANISLTPTKPSRKFPNNCPHLSLTSVRKANFKSRKTILKTD